MFTLYFLEICFKNPGKYTTMTLHHVDILMMEALEDDNSAFSRNFEAYFGKIECKQKDGAYSNGPKVVPLDD